MILVFFNLLNDKLYHLLMLFYCVVEIFPMRKRVAKNISLAHVLPISSGTSYHLSINVVFSLTKTVFLLFTMYSKTPGETKSTNFPKPLLTNSCFLMLPWLSSGIPAPIKISSIMLSNSLPAQLLLL